MFVWLIRIILSPGCNPASSAAESAVSCPITGRGRGELRFDLGDSDYDGDCGSVVGQSGNIEFTAASGTGWRKASVHVSGSGTGQLPLSPRSSHNELPESPPDSEKISPPPHGKSVIRGKVTTDDVSGPIGIAQFVGESYDQAEENYGTTSLKMPSAPLPPQMPE